MPLQKNIQDYKQKLLKYQAQQNSGRKLRIAILLDYQSVQLDEDRGRQLLNQIWLWSTKRGVILFARASADWKKHSKRTTNWIEEEGFYLYHHLKAHSKAEIRQLCQFTATLSMLLELDQWVLVTNTNTFLPLVSHLKGLEKQVWLVGQATRRNRNLVNLVDQFQQLNEMDSARDYLEDQPSPLSDTKEEQKAAFRAHVLNWMYVGDVYYHQVQLDDALTHYQRALEICIKIGDLNTKATLLTKLGCVFEAQKKDEKALWYYQEANRLYERSKRLRMWDLIDEAQAVIKQLNMSNINRNHQQQKPKYYPLQKREIVTQIIRKLRCAHFGHSTQ
ncbi:MAG: DUF2225 domain-containing protein [Candidatus Hermodarchaeota archaeon]